MAAKLERTKTPGIFKRGSRYVFSYRTDGKQRWESARTLEPSIWRLEPIPGYGDTPRHCSKDAKFALGY